MERGQLIQFPIERRKKAVEEERRWKRQHKAAVSKKEKQAREEAKAAEERPPHWHDPKGFFDAWAADKHITGMAAVVLHSDGGTTKGTVMYLGSSCFSDTAIVSDGVRHIKGMVAKVESGKD